MGSRLKADRFPRWPGSVSTPRRQPPTPTATPKSARASAFDAATYETPRANLATFESFFPFSTSPLQQLSDPYDLRPVHPAGTPVALAEWSNAHRPVGTPAEVTQDGVQRTPRMPPEPADESVPALSSPLRIGPRRSPKRPTREGDVGDHDCSEESFRTPPPTISSGTLSPTLEASRTRREPKTQPTSSPVKRQRTLPRETRSTSSKHAHRIESSQAVRRSLRLSPDRVRALDHRTLGLAPQPADSARSHPRPATVEQEPGPVRYLAAPWDEEHDGSGMAVRRRHDRRSQAVRLGRRRATTDGPQEAGVCWHRESSPPSDSDLDDDRLPPLLGDVVAMTARAPSSQHVSLRAREVIDPNRLHPSSWDSSISQGSSRENTPVRPDRRRPSYLVRDAPAPPCVREDAADTRRMRRTLKPRSNNGALPSLYGDSVSERPNLKRPFTDEPWRRTRSSPPTERGQSFDDPPPQPSRATEMVYSHRRTRQSSHAHPSMALGRERSTTNDTTVTLTIDDSGRARAVRTSVARDIQGRHPTFVQRELDGDEDEAGNDNDATADGDLDIVTSRDTSFAIPNATGKMTNHNRLQSQRSVSRPSPSTIDPDDPDTVVRASRRRSVHVQTRRSGGYHHLSIDSAFVPNDRLTNGDDTGSEAETVADDGIVSIRSRHRSGPRAESRTMGKSMYA